jgi:DNA polymerase-3 subunit epsilon
VLITGLDIETTGLDYEKGHRIVEVCVTNYEWDGVNAVKGASWTQRVDPKRSIDPNAYAVHKIAYESLIGQPTWEMVGPKLHEWISNSDVIVAFNGFSFDMPFIAYEFARIGLTLPTRPQAMDPMVQGRFATWNGKPPNLGEFCFACGVHYDPTEAHAAEYDVDRMMEAVWVALRYGHLQLPVEVVAKAA